MAFAVGVAGDVRTVDRPDGHGSTHRTAPFAFALPERIILGRSAPGICTRCNQVRYPLELSAYVGDNNPRSVDGTQSHSDMGGVHGDWEERVNQPGHFRRLGV